MEVQYGPTCGALSSAQIFLLFVMAVNWRRNTHKLAKALKLDARMDLCMLPKFPVEVIDLNVI